MNGSCTNSVIGVDGCAKGWFAVVNDSGNLWEGGVFNTIADICGHYNNAALMLIDIPIGLTSIGQRSCDQLARELLGTRKSSVFTPPARDILRAPDYQAACAVNQSILGKKISKQTWNISKKILEVDKFLQSRSNIRPAIREAHPELAFSSMACGYPMQNSKKSIAGREERLNQLEGIVPGITGIIDEMQTEYLRSHLAHDDVLDAVALAVLASGRIGPLDSLPAKPEYDDMNLRMEIVYAKK